ncbi:prepilin peptidase [Halorubrum sp. JWXQ-INN 858]|uniref:prepilin peptidase n=1 Tax=Halorubrum sp. JWXQ-INN 858 TaxID=2690782 RepID=UPI00135A2243|nr:A24 family peptidase [Halorubrum sp. JWXQ-INN 858]MWV64785.1 prepilin peptidase [Halorubrum sp. JWXQ-INN 858]
MFASLPDLLRLLVVPVFAWAALRDVRTRRLPNRIWPPLYAFGLILLVWEVARLWPLMGFGGRLFVIQAAISLGLVAPLGYAFWYLGAFGGADAKALIGLAVVFPTFPTYVVGTTAFPLVVTDLGVFSLTILTNTVLIGLAYPLGLAAVNLAAGERSATMFFARPVATESLPERHGRLFEDADGTTRHGLDLDALRMYLRWRGLTLAELRSDPERFADPESVGETFDPTDGGTHVGPATDGGEVVADGEDSRDEAAVGDRGRDEDGAEGDADSGGSAHAHDDPWAAERFLAEIDGTAYGTDPDTLRGGLAAVTHRDLVSVSPGMPFVVPMFFGLVLALVYGDLLFALLAVAGLV